MNKSTRGNDYGKWPDSKSFSRYIVTHQGIPVMYIDFSLMNDRVGPVLVGTKTYFETADHPTAIIVGFDQGQNSVGSVAIEESVCKDGSSSSNLVRKVIEISCGGIQAVPFLLIGGNSR